METTLPDPADLDGAAIEHLILTLYRTQDPTERSNVDKILIDLQRSQHGFQIADQLLQSPHDEVRFYGARTFIVKINKDVDTLEKVPQQELLQRLMHWLVFATRESYSVMVLRKLCSALVTFFVQTDGTWNSCVLDVERALFGESLLEYPALGTTLNTQPRCEHTLLLFVSTLLQEVTAMDLHSAKT